MYVGPHCVLEDDVTLEEDVHLVAQCDLVPWSEDRARTIIQPGVVIGGDGFGFAPEQGKWVKVPQVGSVRIGADVEIGANTTIDRGAIEDTVVEEGVKLDNQISSATTCVSARIPSSPAAQASPAAPSSASTA